MDPEAYAARPAHASPSMSAGVASPYNTSTPPPPPPKQTSPYDAQSAAAQQPPPPPPRPGSFPSAVHQPYSPPNTSSPAPPPHPQAYSSHPPPPEQHQQHQQHYQQQQQQRNLPPDGWLPAFAHTLSKPDLEHLLRTPSLVTALAHHPSHSHATLAASTAPLHAQLEANIALAQRLTALETELARRRDATAAHFLAVRGLEQQWRRAQGRLEEALAPFGPRVLHQRLAASIAEGEQECVALEESFLEGEGVASEREAAEWVRRVREGRRKVALRRERRSRWDEGRVGGWR